MRTLMVVAACTMATKAPSAASEIAGRGAFVGSTQLPYIYDIVPDPAEPGSVVLATRGGLYRAWPDGTAERVSREPNQLWSLSVDAQAGGRLYARGVADDGQTRGVLLSEDRGWTWRQLSSGNGAPEYLRIIEASKAAPDLVYGAEYDFWRSVDGGRNWISTGPPPSRVLDLAASAIDAQRVFAATHSDLYASEDGGLSWRPTGWTGCRQPVMAVDTGTDGAVYAFSLCAGLLRGDELTGTWTVVNDRFGGCIVQHLAVDPGNSARVYAVIRCDKVIVSVDGGVTWRELGSHATWEPSCVTYPVGHIEEDS